MSLFDHLTLESIPDPNAGAAEPLQTPVTIIDLERGPCVAMELPMADPCPACGGHNMKVGDWVCWGVCSFCFGEPEDFS